MAPRISSTGRNPGRRGSVPDAPTDYPMPPPTRTQQIGWFVLLTFLLALVLLRWLRLA